MAIAIVVVACGRIGFESRGPGSGSGGGDAHGVDAIVVTGDGSVAGCGYVVCPMNEVACCANNSTSCVPSGTCGGITFECTSSGAGCMNFYQCCVNADTSTYCQPQNIQCPGI